MPQSEPTTDEESINDLIDTPRYQIFHSTQLDAEEPLPALELEATHTKARTAWFPTGTRKKINEAGNKEQKVAYFESQMNSICAP